MAHLPTIDLSTPAGRALVQLVDRLKDAEDDNGGWTGGDVVQLLTIWMEDHGLDPDAPAGSLGSRRPWPCGHCPADLWPGPATGPARASTPAERTRRPSGRTVTAPSTAARPATAMQRPGAGWSATGTDLGTALYGSGWGPLRAPFARIEPGDGRDDGWLVVPDDGAHCFWTPASHAHVLDDTDDGTDTDTSAEAGGGTAAAGASGGTSR